MGGNHKATIRMNNGLYNEGSNEKSKVLIIGATGYMGSFITTASLDLGHPTFALIRPSTLSGCNNAEIIDNLKSSGVIICPGSLNDHDSLVKAIRQVDVVISVVGGAQILDQLKLIDAIKQVGTVKRFLPSEFGHEVDRAQPVEPALGFYQDKRKIRRSIEEAKIGHTYICCNSIAGNLIPASIVAALTHDIFINGCQYKFCIEGADDVEACELYPEIKYVQLEDYFHSLVANDWDRLIS